MLTGTMTAAAQMISITQPAVSRLIVDLEAKIGFALFDRRGKQVEPTSQARALLVEVERAFVGLRHIQAFAEDLRKGQVGSLRIAALPAVAAGFLPRFVAHYSRTRPNLTIALEGLSSNEIRDGLAAGRFDVGITAYHVGLTAFPHQRSSLTITPLGDGAVVLMPADHRLAARPVLRAEDLRDEQMILYSRFALGPHPVEIALGRYATRASIVTALTTIACVLVSEGAGIAIVDRFSAGEFNGRGLVTRPFYPASVIATALVHSNERALSPVAQEFHAAFLDHARRYLEQTGSICP